MKCLDLETQRLIYCIPALIWDLHSYTGSPAIDKHSTLKDHPEVDEQWPGGLFMQINLIHEVKPLGAD